MEQNFKKENQPSFWENIRERLTICWCVLTYHTYAVFFLNKSYTKSRCYVANNFSEFNQTISEFAGNNFQETIKTNENQDF